MVRRSSKIISHLLGIIGLGIIAFYVITGPSLETYQSIVYNNPEVTTIIQQTFYASEFTFRGLNTLNHAIVGLALILLGLIEGLV